MVGLRINTKSQLIRGFPHRQPIPVSKSTKMIFLFKDNPRGWLKRILITTSSQSIKVMCPNPGTHLQRLITIMRVSFQETVTHYPTLRLQPTSTILWLNDNRKGRSTEMRMQTKSQFIRAIMHIQTLLSQRLAIMIV
jgi:hypothetical protein